MLLWPSFAVETPGFVVDERDVEVDEGRGIGVIGVVLVLEGVVLVLIGVGEGDDIDAAEIVDREVV